MTPDQARRLLDGTTPGPWEWCEGKDQNGEFVALCGPDGADALRTWDGDLYASGVHGTNADKALAAAPTLAAMIAGMREEWVGQCLDREGKWATICAYPAREEVAYHLDHGCWDAYTHTRIVRRYVTEPEEA